jgi:hypothetical protein
MRAKLMTIGCILASMSFSAVYGKIVGLLFPWPLALLAALPGGVFFGFYMVRLVAGHRHLWETIETFGTVSVLECAKCGTEKVQVK